MRDGKAELLTSTQRYALYALKMSARFIPSGCLRFRTLPNPGPILRRLEKRGLVESNGVMLPEGRCYRITGKGIAALREPSDA